MESDMINSRNVIKLLSLKLLTLYKYFAYIHNCNYWLGVRHCTEMLPAPLRPTPNDKFIHFIAILFLAYSVNCTYK